MTLVAPVPPTTSWRNRIVGTGEESPADLVANPKNWRLHPQGQQDALAGVLDEVGWVEQVLVNRLTGRLVDGHLRVEIALRRGEPSVPVSCVELTEAEEALVLATLDPLSALRWVGARSESMASARTSKRWSRRRQRSSPSRRPGRWRCLPQPGTPSAASSEEGG